MMFLRLARITRRLMLAEKPRSSYWHAVRTAHLLQFPTCAFCGGGKKLEVHHKLPFHLHPEMELDPHNLVTLCEKSEVLGCNCHLVMGHFGNWKAFNSQVDEDCAIMHNQIVRVRRPNL